MLHVLTHWGPINVNVMMALFSVTIRVWVSIHYRMRALSMHITFWFFCINLWSRCHILWGPSECPGCPFNSMRCIVHVINSNQDHAIYSVLSYYFVLSETLSHMNSQCLYTRPYPPGPYTSEPYGRGPVIIWKNMPSQISSRTKFEMHTRTIYSKHTPRSSQHSNIAPGEYLT